MWVCLDVTGVNHKPFIIRVIDQNLQELLPDASVPPTTKPPMYVFPVTQVGRQVAPGGTCSHDPEDRIDKKPIVPRYSAPLAPSARKVGFQELPGRIRNVMTSMTAHGLSESHMRNPGASQIS